MKQKNKHKEEEKMNIICKSIVSDNVKRTQNKS